MKGQVAVWPTPGRGPLDWERLLMRLALTLHAALIAANLIRLTVVTVSSGNIALTVPGFLGGTRLILSSGWTPWALFPQPRVVGVVIGLLF